MSGRVRRFVDAVRRHCPRGATGLDLGCGTGEITAALSRAGFGMLGMDISEPMVRRARGAAHEVCFEVLPDPYDLRAWWGARERVGFVLASSVLEYVDDVDTTLRGVRSVTELGGVLFATVPAVTPWRMIERRLRPLALSAHRAGVARGLPSRARGYVEYLALSKNRQAITTWQIIGARNGFELIDTNGSREALVMLVFRAR